MVYTKDSTKRIVLNRYSFPIDDQNTLVFLDPQSYIDVDSIYVILASLEHLHKINRFAAFICINNSASLEDDSEWENFTRNSLEISEDFQGYVFMFNQVFLIFTNSPSRALNLDRSRLRTVDNVNFYFMQNSAYQLFKAPSIKYSMASDFRQSMETTREIIKKIIHRIHHRR